MAEEMLFPNGSVITPDGADADRRRDGGARYTAFTIADDGSLSDRRIWAQVAQTPPNTRSRRRSASSSSARTGAGSTPTSTSGRPTRSAPAACASRRAVRSLRRSLPEGLDVFACMLGGDDGRTLLMCAAPDFLEHNRGRHRRRPVSPRRWTSRTPGCRDRVRRPRPTGGPARGSCYWISAGHGDGRCWACASARGRRATDELIEALWGGDAPPTAAKALQVTVSRLRRALGPAADRLETAVGRRLPPRRRAR